MSPRQGYLNYYVDVSGGPGGKTIFGLVGIKNTDLGRVMKDVFRTFPKLRSKKSKSAKMNETELETIVRFLDSKNVIMRALIFEKSDWNYYKRNYSCMKQHFYSRMYGILYTKLLTNYSYREHFYPVVFCNEDYLSNKELAKNICVELSCYDQYEFSISHSRHKTYAALKLADIVAGAVRKLGKAKMNELSSFRQVGRKIPSIYILKAFGKYKN